MQITIFCKESDTPFIDRLDALAKQERMSRSALVMAALESHYQELLPLGKLLYSQGALSQRELNRALALQRVNPDKPLGKILVDEQIISEQEVEQALNTQSNALVSAVSNRQGVR